ncbi:DNA-directed RNA polymerase [Alteromonas sp. RKMC-009]|uniref:DNA-directed RNA polymerase n=1 Tax=Alteromonas sp. RKMC-009 TaxID=2267264 RepID=UPI000E67FA37|nr:DNA-directed RNA polymerase [Alteromonas sp. RKMC-009]AYA64302.1 hypothetical protein DS731_10005 [Alteromonas sp. RKMC-009]
MQTFTGTEYVKIAIANAYGMDKDLFEDRIEWVSSKSMEELYALVPAADEPPIMYAGILALEDAVAKRPSGFMVGLDACSSGLQLMGAMHNCAVTAENTGLINPSERADIYTQVTDVMNKLLVKEGITITLDRKLVKPAVMTHFYGSKEKPKEIFGEDTVELECFYEALELVAPGACEVMQHLLNAWQPYALSHDWILPDGFNAHCPVTEALQFRVEVAELGKATFDHVCHMPRGTEKGLSVAANVIHSIDGMVVREMNRRCNYDPVLLDIAREKIEAAFAASVPKPSGKFVSLRWATALATGDIALADVLTVLPDLYALINRTLEYKPFPIVCVHDEFKCHANHMNRLRMYYRDIFAELSASDLLEDILSQIHGVKYKLPKLGNITNQIKQCNYALS